MEQEGLLLKILSKMKKWSIHMTASFLTVLLLLLKPLFLKDFLPIVSKELLATLLLILLLLLIWSLAFLISLIVEKDRSIQQKYRFDKRKNIHIHKKTGEYFCSDCMFKDKEIPLKVSRYLHQWLALRVVCWPALP